MRKIFEYIGSPHDSREGREEIEWANFWYSEAATTPDKETGRILLVGDSTARMVRSTFEKYAKKPVDMLGTSSGLHDILFLNQMDAFFCSTNFQYNCIFIQMGHHSIIGESGSKYNESDYHRFYVDYKGLVDFLLQYTENIILLTCFLNVKPYPKPFSKGIRKVLYQLWKRIRGEEIDYSWSDVVIRKNEIIKRVAEEKNLQFCDIDATIRSSCSGFFPKYIHVDHIHYENKAKRVIVNNYLKYCNH